MKITMIIVRTLMGLMFLFASITFLFHLVPTPPMTGNVKTFMDGLMVTGYFMTFLKVTELVCGLAFVTGLYVPLANVVICPIILNIVFFHAFLEPSGLPVAIPLLLANLFLAYYYRRNYA